MGIIRKATSNIPLGAVHYQAPDQKVAQNAKKSCQMEKGQARQASRRPSDVEEVTAAIGSVMRGVEKMFRRRGAEPR